MTREEALKQLDSEIEKWKSQPRFIDGLFGSEQEQTDFDNEHREEREFFLKKFIEETQ